MHENHGINMILRAVTNQKKPENCGHAIQYQDPVIMLESNLTQYTITPELKPTKISNTLNLSQEGLIIENASLGNRQASLVC